MDFSDLIDDTAALAKIATSLGREAEFQAYRRGWAEATKGKAPAEFPLQLNFETSYKCDLACPMCTHSQSAEEKEEFSDTRARLSLEKFKEIIDEGVPKGLVSVNFNSINEPLLNKELPKFISYARERGVLDLMIHTNARSLTEDRAKAILEAGLTRIMFSLDSIRPETYKIIRVGSDYDLVMGNILRFLDLKKKAGKSLPITRVSFVRNMLNQPELEEFVSFWREKVDYFLIQGFSNPAVGKSYYKEVEDRFRIHNEGQEIEWDCGEPYQKLVIRGNGDVVPCCSWYGIEMVLGNVFKSTVSEIWTGKAAQNVRASVNRFDGSEPEACKKCRFASVDSRLFPEERARFA